MRKHIIGSLAALAVSVSALAANPPITAGAGYEPQDKDERGLWMQMNEYERELKHSPFVIRDEKLNTYVRGVFCGTVGQAECANIRIYLMRTPYFNASMAPNGLMQIYSGMFLRTRNEAQMASVIGHEYVHFNRRHSLQLFRDIKKKLAMGAWLGAFGLIGSLVQFGLVSSIFTFSREMETEADTGSIPLLKSAGYDLHAASAIWEQIRAEQDATALARGKKSRKDKNGGMFATHPPTAERMIYLKKLADENGAGGNLKRGEYMAALAPFWADFVDDQIKLNDFGGTEFLLGHLSLDGWTPELLYARGELYRGRGRPEDLTKAAAFYQQSLTSPLAPVEAWRGLGLAQLRSGKQAEGQASLKTYLEKQPDSKDRAMIMSLAGG